MRMLKMKLKSQQVTDRKYGNAQEISDLTNMHQRSATESEQTIQCCGWQSTGNPKAD